MFLKVLYLTDASVGRQWLQLSGRSGASFCWFKSLNPVRGCTLSVLSVMGPKGSTKCLIRSLWRNKLKMHKVFEKFWPRAFLYFGCLINDESFQLVNQCSSY